MKKIKSIIANINPKTQWDEKIAIIGAGPAGLSCAYYLATLGYSPTVFEKEAYPGGMMRYGIPSYKLEKNIIDAEIDVIRQLGVDIRCNVEVGKNITIEQLKKEFVERGASYHNYKPETTTQIYEKMIEPAASYSFNKSFPDSISFQESYLVHQDQYYSYWGCWLVVHTSLRNTLHWISCCT